MKLKTLMLIFLLFAGVSHAATAPSVTGLWPGSGGSGTFVFVFGSDFVSGATSVSVNGASAPLVQVMDPTLLIFMVPPGNPTGPVTVTTQYGNAASGTSFGVPLSGLTVTGLWPGTTEVGKFVFVFGSGYVAGAGSTTAAVNSVQAPLTQVLDPSLMIFMVPSGASSGPVKVSVANAAASTTSMGNLTITPPPDGFEGTWVAPDPATIPNNAEGDMIRYGKELLSKTAYYFNTLGVVPGYSTGSDLNCTNCHLENGARAYSSPWAVAYYKYSGTGQYAARSGRYLTNEGRIQGCMKRSMNAQTQTLPETGYEMQSMVAYFKWLATGMKVADWTLVKGQGFIAVTDMTRAADPVRGQSIYEMKCARCHGQNGQGLTMMGVTYPPVWGSRSFNDGAGMFRPRTGVRFIKGNMPFGIAFPTDPTTQLSTEDAWDVASYVVYQNRPVFFNLVNDWSCTHAGPDGVPDWMRKAPDAGYAPYRPRWDGVQYSCDTTYPQVYDEIKHKYGPWQDMLSLQTKIITDFKACGRSPCP